MPLHFYALASCLAVFAANRSDAERADRRAPAARAGLDRSAMHRVSETIGKVVRNGHGAELGEVTELILDDRGTTVYAVLSIDRSLGGNRLYPVPWSELEPAGDSLVLALSAERLCRAPSFHKHDWPDLTDAAWGVAVRRYYAEALAAEAAAADAFAAAAPAPADAVTGARNTEGPASRPGQRTVRGILVGIERVSTEDSGRQASRLKLRSPGGIVVVQIGTFPLAVGEGTRLELDEVLEVTGVMARTSAGPLLIAREVRTGQDPAAPPTPR
jgi:sporulation protein YlmC with PRC-barrel domain